MDWTNVVLTLLFADCGLLAVAMWMDGKQDQE